MNMDYRDWVSTDKTRIEFESLKFTGNAALDSGDAINFDVRHYDNVIINVVRYAEYQWNIDQQSHLKLGITRVPFGIQNFLSDSFWFSINYYLGLEDDYDLGGVYSQHIGAHQFKLGYFLTDEIANSGSFKRFSFDVASVGEFRYKEDGQINFHYQYAPVVSGKQAGTVGVSLQWGEIHNNANGDSDTHYAWSLFYRHPYGNWQTTAQISQYRYDVAGQQNIQFSAFDSPYPVIKKANSYVLNQSYRVTEPPALIDSILAYTEIGVVHSEEQGARNSVQWVTGANFTSGNFVFYLDYIYGKNMWFSGGSGVGVYFPDSSFIEESFFEEPGTTGRINFSTAYQF